MARSLGVALLATGAIVIASAIGVASRGVAQDRPGASVLKLAEAAQTDQKKATTPRTVAPRTVTPRTVTPKTVAPPRTTTGTPRVTSTSKQLGTQKTITTKRVVTPKQTITPKVVTPKVTTPKVVTPKTTISKTTTLPKTAAPKTASPTRLGLRTIGPSSTGSTLICGRNYTVWRGSHRVRHNGRWATLAGWWLAKRKHYWFCFVVACLACAFSPLGTVLGVFTIIVLLRPSVKALFEGAGID